MKKFSALFAFVFLLSIFALSQAQTSQGNACWGQASAVFAQIEAGNMGVHSSDVEQFNNPGRLGLYNLAVFLVDSGVIELEEGEEPSLQVLGAWLVEMDPTLTVDACME